MDFPGYGHRFRLHLLILNRAAAGKKIMSCAGVF
jgi:hypothetical protein